MSLWPPNRYKKQAIAHGTPPSAAAAAVEQAHPTQSRGLPALLSLNHLGFETDVPYPFLRAVVERRHDPYRSFATGAKNGGKTTNMRSRVSNACGPEVDQSLDSIQTVSSSSKQRLPPWRIPISVRAELHAGCRWLIKVDIEEFFESLSEIDAYRAFVGMGYQPLVAFELGRLCTRVVNHPRYDSPRWRRDAHREDRIHSYSHPLLGHLPQGAPTSPMLSNLIMHSFDSRLGDLAHESECIYTRYSDDLIFSSTDGSLDRASARELVVKVYLELARIGLRPRRTKTIIVPPSARKVVLGLLVDGDRPRLSKQFRRKLELHLYMVERVGPQAHALHRGFDSVLGLRHHLFGLVAFARSVDVVFAERIESRLLRLTGPYNG